VTKDMQGAGTSKCPLATGKSAGIANRVTPFSIILARSAQTPAGFKRVKGKFQQRLVD
jgi:hypothetical protein